MADLHYMEMGWSGSGWMDPLPTEPTPAPAPAPAAPAPASPSSNSSAAAPSRPRPSGPAQEEGGQEGSQEEREEVGQKGRQEGWPGNPRRRSARRPARKAARKRAGKGAKKSAKRGRQAHAPSGSAKRAAKKSAKRSARKSAKRSNGAAAERDAVTMARSQRPASPRGAVAFRSCIDRGADPPSSTSSRRADAPPQSPRGHGPWAVPAPRVPLAGAGRRGAARRDADRRQRRPAPGGVGDRGAAAAVSSRSGCAATFSFPSGRPRWTSPAAGSCPGWWTGTSTWWIPRPGSPVVDGPVSRVGRDDRAGRPWPAPKRAGAAPGDGPRLAAGAPGVFRGRDDRRRAADISRRDHRRIAKDARRGVDRLVNAGADLIKVYTRVDKDAARGPAGRGAHLQSSGRRAPGTHRCGDGRATGAGVAGAHERGPRGRLRRSVRAVRRAPAVVLRGMDGVRAGLGRSRLGVARRGSRGCWRRAA